MIARARALARGALDAILPPRCVVSGQPVEAQGMLAPAAWSAMTFLTPPLCRCCGDMFSFGGEVLVEEAGESGLCRRCARDPQPFTSARAAIAYDGAGRDLILGFKHADKTHAVPAFVPWLERAGAKALAAAELLVPVPLHPRRLLARRYNQAAVMAAALSRQTGIPHAPLALERARVTESQGHKSREERAKNVAGAFRVPESRAHCVRGRAVALLDDVYTTGATVRTCASALLEAGSGPVHVLTLARVVRV